MWDVLRTPPARWGAVLWLGTNGLGIAAGLWSADPVRISALGLHAVYAAHLSAALFFLLFIWPLLIPWAARAAETPPRGFPGAKILATHLLLFAALGAPPALLSARLAEVGTGAALRSVAVLVAAAACVTAFFARLGWNGPRASALYPLAAWLVSAAGPFAYYLGREWTDADWIGLAALSPFWGVVEPDAVTPWGPLWGVQAAGYGTVAALVAAASALAARRVTDRN